METGYKDINFDDTLLVALTTGIVPPSNAFPSAANEATFFRKLCEQQRATNVVLQAEIARLWKIIQTHNKENDAKRTFESKSSSILKRSTQSLTCSEPIVAASPPVKIRLTRSQEERLVRKPASRNLLKDTKKEEEQPMKHQALTRNTSLENLMKRLESSDAPSPPSSPTPSDTVSSPSTGRSSPLKEYVDYITRDTLETIRVNTSKEACKKFGFYSSSRVSTPRGPATVIGVYNGKLWFHIDNEIGASFWGDVKSYEDLVAKGVVLLEPPKESETTNQIPPLSISNSSETVRVRLTDSGKKMSCVNVTKRDQEERASSPDTGPLPNPSPRRTFDPLHDLNKDTKFMINGQLTDITVTCSSDPPQGIRCHKAMLCCRSPRLKDILFENKSLSRLQIRECASIETLAAFIEFIYTDTFTTTNSNVINELQILAKIYCLTKLIALIESSYPERYPSLNEQLLSMFNDKSYFSDVTFLVEEIEVFAHKAVLLHRCPYFQGLLSPQFKEGRQSIIQIDDLSCKAFTAILKWIYSSKLSTTISQETAIEVLQAAQKFLLNSLFTQTEMLLISTTTVNTCCSMFYYGDLYNAYGLREHAVSVILDEFVRVALLPAFHQLPDELFTEVLQRKFPSKPQENIRNSIKKLGSIMAEAQSLKEWIQDNEMIITYLQEEEELWTRIRESAEQRAERLNQLQVQVNKMHHTTKEEGEIKLDLKNFMLKVQSLYEVVLLPQCLEVLTSSSDSMGFTNSNELLSS